MSSKNKILENILKSHQKLNEAEKKPTKEIEDVVADKIFQTIPKDTVLHFDNAVDYVNRQTGIPTDLISHGLVKAISKKKFITDKSGTHVRKNEI